MKRFSLTLLLVGLALPSLLLGEESDAAVAARQRNLDLAGAFSNDGYKIRDGHWTGTLEAGKDIFVEVSLFTGNSYWFITSSNQEEKRLKVTLFDETGKEVEGSQYSERGRAAASFTPEFSGPFYIRLQLLDGAPTEVCLLYCYK